jgi:hypothetical protein
VCEKYQGKTPLNNEYTLTNMKDRKVKHVLSRNEYQWEWERAKKEGAGSEYGRCILSMYKKIKQ